MMGEMSFREAPAGLVPSPIDAPSLVAAQANQAPAGAHRLPLHDPADFGVGAGVAQAAITIDPSAIGASGRLLAGLVRAPSPGRRRAVVRIRVGTYLLPVDVVATIGNGDLERGAERLDELRGRTPSLGANHPDRWITADLVAGLYAVPPDRMRAIGGGSARRAAELLDREVAAIRQQQRRGAEAPRGWLS